MIFENEIAKEIVDAAYQTHVSLGPGLLETVYEEVMHHILTEKGYDVKRQVSVPIFFEDKKLEKGFIADLIINDKVIIELKSVEELKKVHHKQLLTYLRLTNMKLGLLINFNENLIKDGIKRIANNLEN